MRADPRQVTGQQICLIKFKQLLKKKGWTPSKVPS
jgi:hypothetical protein